MSMMKRWALDSFRCEAPFVMYSNFSTNFTLLALESQRIVLVHLKSMKRTSKAVGRVKLSDLGLQFYLDHVLRLDLA